MISEDKPNVDEVTQDQGFEACFALLKGSRVSDFMDLIRDCEYDMCTDCSQGVEQRSRSAAHRERQEQEAQP